MTKHEEHLLALGAARERVIGTALAQGRFPASRRAHYERLFDADPIGTTALISKLAPVLPAAEAVEASSYPERWLPDVRRKRAELAASGGRRPRVSFGA